MANPVKLFIVEGERDRRYTEELLKCFFKGKYTAKFISLSANQNLYMLYDKLAEDNFETDIVEVLRENVDTAIEELNGITKQDISEVYLFFDYDPQQKNIRSGGESAEERIRLLLSTFDNETENGRLYLNYPMVEAVYDYRGGGCKAFSDCFVPIGEIGHYKELSGKDNPIASQNLKINHWREILNTFYLRLTCLLGFEDIGYSFYRNRISPQVLFEIEKNVMDNTKSVFVLSAFPEFLFDYFKEDFWRTMVRRKKKALKNRNDCSEVALKILTERQKTEDLTKTLVRESSR